MGFDADVDRFIVDVRKVIATKTKATVLYGMDRVAAEAPVDKGTFRANTYHAQGEPGSRFDSDNQGEPPPPNLVEIDPEQDQYIVNNTPYGPKLNAGHGRRPQAPAGWWDRIGDDLGIVWESS